MLRLVKPGVLLEKLNFIILAEQNKTSIRENQRERERER